MQRPAPLTAKLGGQAQTCVTLAINAPQELLALVRSNVAIAATRKRDAAPFCGEPPNCPLTVMVTVSAKLTFDRIDPDLEVDSARMEPCGAKSRGVSP
jgi:hypothetical protein